MLSHRAKKYGILCSESVKEHVHLITLISILSFFFSSRRRHTIFDCDWSSDVCSSDLIFELKDHDSLGEVIAFAGGLTTTAAGQRAIIERIDERHTRTADEFPLSADGLDRKSVV